MGENTNELVVASKVEWGKALWGDALRYIPSYIIPAVVGFLTISLWTNRVSPDEFARYSLVMSAIWLFIPLFSWLPQAVLRYLAEAKAQGQEKSIYTISVVSFIVLLVVIGAFGYGVSLGAIRLAPTSDFGILLWYGTLSLLGRAGFRFISAFAQARRQSLRYGIYSSLYRIGLLIFSLSLIHYLGPTARALLLAGVAADVCLFLYDLFRSLSQRQVAIITPWAKQTLRQMFLFGMPLAISQEARWLLALSDRYLLGRLSTLTQVGLYAAAYDLADRAIAVFSVALLTATFPVIVAADTNEGRLAATKLLQRSILMYLTAVGGILVLLASLTVDVVNLVLGAEYRTLITYIVLPTVSSGVALLGAADFFGQLMRLRNETRQIALFTFIAGGANVLLNLLMIPRLGAIAAAINTLLSYGLLFGLMFSLETRKGSVDTRRILTHILKLLAVAAVVIGLNYLLFPGLGHGWGLLVLKAALLTIFYILGLLAVREEFSRLVVSWGLSKIRNFLQTARLRGYREQ